MFILETHFWSFLSIFEGDRNLSDAYKNVEKQCRKSSHWENRLSRWDNFVCSRFLINKFYSQIKKVFTQNEPKFSRIEYFLTHRKPQWVSGSCYCGK